MSVIAAPIAANERRIAQALDAIAALDDDPGGEGVTRLAYTPMERRAHVLVGGWLGDLGLTVTTDGVGNTIAELPGSVPGLPALGTGSHLDSVPAGGRFDGVAGVVAGVEIVRLWAARGVRLRHPLRVVLFAAEEGARFGQACLGSKAVAGLLTTADTHERTDKDGITLAAAMAALDFNPERIADAAWPSRDWAAFVELHIEQGRVLETEDADVGIVDLISGSTRLRMTLTGRPSHTGGTPMALRIDALTAASEIVLLAERIATDPRHRGTRATVGQLTVFPNSITTIPGEVRLAVDIRDVDSDRQRETAREIAREAKELCTRREVGLEVAVIGDISPAVLPIWLREVTVRASREAGVRYRVLFSGASHDAQMVNHTVPAAMIFVPSREGLSHVCDEWTSASQIARGINVLARSLELLDTELDAAGTSG